MLLRALRLGAVTLAMLAAAARAPGEWLTLGTDSFLLFYPRSREEVARRALEALEEARPRVEALTGGKLRRLPVVIEDLGTYANGSADPILRAVRLYPYEFEPSIEVGFSEDWIRSLAVHELAHMGHLGAAPGFPAVPRALFGPALATGLLSTRWLTEGVAIWAESWSSPWEGRLHEGFFDALVGVQAREGTLPSLARATFSAEGYPFGNSSYVYGGAFVRWLAGLEGEAALAAFLGRIARSPLTYVSPLLPLAGPDRAARAVWGARLPELWRRWGDWEASRAPPADPGLPVGSPGAADITGLAGAEGAIYYARSDQLKTARETVRAIRRVVRIGPAGEERTVLATPDAFSCPIAVRDGRLYYAVGELEAGHANTSLAGFGLTSALRVRDLATGSDAEILRAPLRCFAVRPDGSILYAVDAAGADGSELWELGTGSASSPRFLRSLDLRVFEMAADDRRLVLCAREAGQNTDLYLLDAAAAAAEPEALVSSPWSEKTISLQGDRLLYSVNTEGRHGIEALDLATGERLGCASGEYAVRPWHDADTGRLYYVGLESDGLRVMARPLELRPAAPPAPSPDPAPARPPSGATVQAREAGAWPNLLTLVPRIRLPVATTDLQSVKAGAWLAGESALGDISYDLRAWYDVMTRLPSVEASVSFRFAAPVAVGLSYDSAAAHELELTVGLTPFRRLQPGVSSVGLALTATARETFGRLDLAPELGLTWRSAWLRGGAGLRVPLERVELGAAENTVGLAGSAWLVAIVGGGELGATVSSGWSSTGSTSFLPIPAGHISAPDGSPGVGLSLSWERVLLRVRNGLWNPAVYVGDLLGKLFVQAAATPQELALAAGIEAAAELRLLALSTGLPLTVGGWIGIDEEAKLIWGLTGVADLPLLGGAGRR